MTKATAILGNLSYLLIAAFYPATLAAVVRGSIDVDKVAFSTLTLGLFGLGIYASLTKAGRFWQFWNFGLGGFSLAILAVDFIC